MFLACGPARAESDKEIVTTEQFQTKLLPSKTVSALGGEWKFMGLGSFENISDQMIVNFKNEKTGKDLSIYVINREEGASAYSETASF